VLAPQEEAALLSKLNREPPTEQRAREGDASASVSGRAAADEESAQQAARLVTVYQRLEEIDAHAAEARAATILAGLSFTAEMQVGPHDTTARLLHSRSAA
jgi:ATPase subunit of ABC transporter with duplicated ATPase domains